MLMDVIKSTIKVSYVEKSGSPKAVPLSLVRESEEFSFILFSAFASRSHFAFCLHAQRNDECYGYVYFRFLYLGVQCPKSRNIINLIVT